MARARHDARAAEMEALFFAMPEVTLADGSRVALAPEHVKAISAAWKNPALRSRAEVELTEFFRNNYRRVVSMGGG